MMAKGRPEEALKLLEAVVSEEKHGGDLRVTFLAPNEYIRQARRLGRYEETVAMAIECLAETYCGDSSQKYAASSSLAFAYRCTFT